MSVRLAAVLCGVLLAYSTQLFASAYKISSKDDFVDFTNAVNSGNSFQGSTVFLENDISLDDTTSTVIGSSGEGFCGTFDGQGHVITNFNNSTEGKYAGLFGISSKGTTIKNIVLGTQSSVTNNANLLGTNNIHTYTGGIIGFCDPTSCECIIENCVNMATITFTGYSSYDNFIGGVIGDCKMDDKECRIRNCVNTGLVKNTGNAKNNIQIGGIAGRGFVWKDKDNDVYIENCINYGNVISSGECENINHGGVVGNGGSYSRNGKNDGKTYVRNCVDAHGIEAQTGTVKKSANTGNIVGGLDGDYSEISNCYWNSGSSFSCTGNGKSCTDSYSFDINYLTYNGGISLVQSLNDYAAKNNGYNKWAGIKFNTNGGTSFNLQLVLLTYQNKYVELPTPTRNGAEFAGWFADNNFKTSFDLANLEEGGVTAYARWKGNVTFYANGKVYETQKFNTDETFCLPKGNPTKEGHTFVSWTTFNDTTMVGFACYKTQDTTVRFDAIWSKNKYTIKFMHDGTEVASEQQMYGNPIMFPDNPTKSGHVFFNWCTEDNSNCDMKIVPANDVTLYARFYVVTITTGKELKEFSDDVNTFGVTYSGLTVTLDADVNMNGIAFEPAGKLGSTEFQGTFDGNGHTISGLSITDDGSTGIFGAGQTGFHVKNLVIDSSCSFTSTGMVTTTSYVGVGSVVGVLNSNSLSTVENIVNMASVSLRIDKSSVIACTGGIAGLVHGEVTVRNCVNYGTVFFSGSQLYAGVGGIAGALAGASVINSVNYGTITSEGSSTFSGVGGIAGGIIYGARMENCVNTGRINAQGTSDNTGSLFGLHHDHCNVTKCYWGKGTAQDYYGKDMSNNAYFDSVSQFKNDDFTIVESGQSLVEMVNSYTESSDGWAQLNFNTNGGELSKGTLNTRFLLVLYPEKQMSFPTPTKGNAKFLGWLNAPVTFKEQPFDMSELNKGKTELCAKWSKSYIRFDTEGGTDYESLLLDVGLKFSLDDKEPNRTISIFNGWTSEQNINKTDDGSEYIVPEYDVTFEAKWTTALFLMTFYHDEEFHSNSTQEYRKPIQFPADIPPNEGYTLVWCVDNNISECNLKTVPMKNTTFYSRWVPNNYTVRFIDKKSKTDTEEVHEYNTSCAFPFVNATQHAGYTFGEWEQSTNTNNKNKTVTYINATHFLIAAYDVTFTAVWSVNSYTITFMDGNGSVHKKQTQKYEERINYPTNLTKEGHTTHWCTEDGKCDITTVPANDTVFYPNFTANNYSVTFLDENDTIYLTRTQLYASSIYYPENISMTGHTTVWCLVDDNETCSIKAVPAYDVTFAPFFEINNYTITFIVYVDDDYNTEVAHEEITQEYGTNFDMPSEPERIGHTFGGWKMIDGTPFNMTTIPPNNITVTGLLIPNTYSVTYMDGETKMGVRYHKFNTTVKYIEVQTDEGYTTVMTSEDEYTEIDTTHFVVPMKNIAISVRKVTNKNALSFANLNPFDGDEDDETGVVKLKPGESEILPDNCFMDENLEEPVTNYTMENEPCLLFVNNKN